MPYRINLLPGERVLCDVDFEVIQQFAVSSPSLRLVVTNFALFLPTTKFAFAGDTRCFNRIPLEKVKQVRVRAVRPHGAYWFGTFLAFAGVWVLSALVMDGETRWSDSMAFGIALVLGAGLIAFLSKRKSRLVVRWQKGAFVWNPPFVVDSVSKRQINHVLDTILFAAKEAHLSVHDERVTDSLSVAAS